MKKLTIMMVLAVTTCTVTNAQKLDAAKVPAAVKAAFAKQYPGITCKWEKEDGQYEASFKQDGHSVSATYEATGSFTESETDIKVAELPANILAYVKAHYKGKTIKEGAKITKADGTINYEAEVNGKDVIFDAKGNFLKEMKD
ncbi:PepSY-like domain-containing protein [Ferruginibacter sp. SUN106]|uniref:PepSY-like domain-containing protein n=1 Tax=Ferruginibacter sp. SUN106 TaxID=2978348 RepID=UPI003D364B94